MTPEAQRIAIAEACGWAAVWEACRPPIDYHKMLSWKFEGKITGRTPPDYPNDLNAMTLAWYTLHIKQQIIACNKLVNLCGGIEPAINATAAQRAEAFLKTIGKWEDE